MAKNVSGPGAMELGHKLYQEIELIGCMPSGFDSMCP